MKRRPTKSNIPECFGAKCSKSYGCSKCRFRPRCHSYYKSSPRTLAQLNQDFRDREIDIRESAETWTADDGIALCIKLSGKYGKEGWYTSPMAVEIIEKALAYCDAEGIDPKIWITSQFYALGWFFEEKHGRSVPVSVLTGPKAIDRYNKYLFETGREATGNIRRKEAQFDSSIYMAEFLYGQAVIVLGLEGIELKQYERELRKDHRDWDRKDWPVVRQARTCAAVTIAEQQLRGASLRICPPRRAWTWKELHYLLLLLTP